MPLLLAFAAFLSGSPDQSPIACNLNALTPAERELHAQVTGRLRTSVVRIEDVKDGYRLHVSASFSTTDLFRWVEFERRCCSFLDFDVRLDREHGARWVQLSGREGVKAFLALELGLKSTGEPGA